MTTTPRGKPINTHHPYLDTHKEWSGSLTDKELADLLAVSRATVTAWRQRGTIPPVSILYRACRALGRSVDMLCEKCER